MPTFWRVFIRNGYWILLKISASIERIILCVCVCLFAFSRATPEAYGGAQARGLIRAIAASLRQSHSNAGIWAMSVTYTTAHSNAGSFTHWGRPGIVSTTAWFLVGFGNHWAMTGTPQDHMVFILSLLMWCITLIYLQILKNPCIPGINPTWSFCAILSMYCWIRFSSILLRIFASMFISEIGL